MVLNHAGRANPSPSHIGTLYFALDSPVAWTTLSMRDWLADFLLAHSDTIFKPNIHSFNYLVK